MKKRIHRKSRKSNSMKKIIPLSIAIAMLSSGTALAAPEFIDVDMGDGKTARFSTALLNSNDQYKDMVEDALRKAFVNNRSIIIKDDTIDGDDKWINFGTATQPGANRTYNDLVGQIKAGATGDLVATPIGSQVALDLLKIIAEARELLESDNGSFDQGKVTELEELLKVAEELFKDLDKLPNDSDLQTKIEEIGALMEVIEEDPTHT